MKLILLVISCVLAFFVKGQSPGRPSLVLTHVTEENGLSDNHVTAVFKDHSNMVWVGTRDGLNMLDGSTIYIFKNHPDDSGSLCNNYITGITEDINKTIWISTANGVCCYNKKEKRFISIKPGQGKNTEIGGVCNIVADKNDGLWFGTSHGLMHYGISSQSLELYVNTNTNFDTDPTYSNRINHVIVASDNTIWLASSDGLWNYTPSSRLFKKIIHKKNDPYYNPLCQYVYESHDKKIWAGFWSSGLKNYDPSTGLVTDEGKDLHHSYGISAIAEIKETDGNNILWLNGSLLAFDPKTSSYFNFEPPVNFKEPLETWPVFTSEDGWIWLGSNNGLYIFNPGRQVFHHQLFKADFTTQGVSVLDHKNALLVGGQDRNFLSLRNESGQVIHDYSYLCQHTAAMLSMLRSGPEDFWISSTEGILHANLASQEKKWFRHSDGDSTSLPRNFITSVFIDSRNTCWVFPWREGIWQMDQQSGHCKKLWDGFIRVDNKIKKLLINEAREDPAGNIWMADLDEGIILYDVKTKTFSKPFATLIGEKVPTSRIFMVKGKMYTAIPDALIRWDWTDRKPERIPLPAEFNKYIVDIYPDHSGNWWLSTHAGLILYNEAANSFHRFTVADGLYQNDITGNLFCTASNTMMIVSPGYFSAFKPEQLNNVSAPAMNTVLTVLLAGKKNLSTVDSTTISLSHNENNIIIRWALPSYNDPLHNRYYHQLKDIDSAWHFTGNKGELQYANLSPGHYTILLKAATSNGIPSGNIITLHFTIRQPYWKTGWFISLLILFIGCLFFLAVRYISQRNLKEKLLRLEKQQAIEKERNRISRDMHDDLGSGLTKIAILSEVVKRQMNEPEKARQQLENISESSRELVDNLQDIIWVLSPSNDTLESLAAYTREYALKFFEPFGIQVKFNYPEKFLPLKLSEETRRNIFLVVKETLNNTAKHSGCDKLLITIEQSNSSILLSVEDNGKGFDFEKARPFSNGLTNMKNRIEQIGGECKVSSGHSTGTKTTIKIPV